MKYIYIISFLFGSIFVKAQNFKGAIYDDNKQGLIGAYVLNTVTSKHTHTDQLGGFFLEEVKVGDILLVSHLGFKNQSIAITDVDQFLQIEMEKSIVKLEEVVVSPDIDAMHLFTDINLKINPVNSSQEILQQVPGLFIGQHAGGGKAEQLFLRGFDLDHGTDIAIQVDGMPVNMVSHAHGQGYADLHFLIPETIDHIDFGKGSYYADQGNFNTAGYVGFNTKNRLDNSLLKVDVGMFNSQRILGMVSLLDKPMHAVYVASEYQVTDGPFESSQNFNRVNLLAKYSGSITGNEKIGLLVSHFESQWDASGQIPQRKVSDATISRFGAIDDTEGGLTGRTNIALDYTRFLSNRSFVTSKLFYNFYDFELYSNFTFFLNDPVNGDQIKQKESRSILGFNTEYNKYQNLTWADVEFTAGISLRSDDSRDNYLARTKNRQEILSYIQQGDIIESNLALYSEMNIEMNRFTLNIGLRLDHFRFQYKDNKSILYDNRSVSRSIVSPKLNLLYQQSSNLQYYLKLGKGFHSNDSRGVVVREGLDVLPAAYSGDLGLIWKPTSKLLVNTSIWNLYLEQEFVYVGDEGVIEPSGETNRQGVDISARYQPFDYLFINLDGNYTLARSLGNLEGENYIPLAPDLTLKAGLKLQHPSGFYGGIDVRHMDDRPANEDNSIVAEGYTVVDLNVGYSFKQFDLGMQIFNVFDTEWNETQFATESRLQDEPISTEEIHFTPGTPFFLKGSVAYKF